MSVQLIIGLGNPGEQYTNTRHNAGVWFLDAVAREFGGVFKPEKKFMGAVATVSVAGASVRLLAPSTYMNDSGRSAAALINFYQIDPEKVLVAHDELDLEPGVARIKNGGGLAGHNGLKDISRSLSGFQGYHRLRVGIGRPSAAGGVTNYVLKAPGKNERADIDEALHRSLAVLPDMVSGAWESAML
ncbi:MAG: aminoacyl-tRNA hydrolase, partial [Pseudomonadales bacterium]